MIRIMLSARCGENRVSQAELARMTGIRRNTIGDYYNDFAERISLDHLDRICEALDCTPSDILRWEPNKTRRVEYTVKELLAQREKDRRTRR